MNNLSRTAAVLLASAAVSLNGLQAQERTSYVTDLHIETRMAWEYTSMYGSKTDTGFKGQWLNVRFDGQIAPGLTYTYRQRLNRNTEKTFFDATDLLHLDWQALPKLNISAGKQVVALGGYEYDRAPIDLYYCCEFWNNVSCYQLGLSATYDVSTNDKLLLQLCNSPFRVYAGNDIYAFNFMWYGKHGCWETMWSASMLQRDKDRWMAFVVLGNRINFAPWLNLDIDLMSRETFKDYSIIGELSARPVTGLTAFVKYIDDCNCSDSDIDPLVMQGTQLQTAEIGVEWSPLKLNRSGLKFFCVGKKSWGNNANPDGTILDGEFRLQVGFKYKFKVI